MDFMKKTQNLVATLTKEFNCEEINLTVQMRRGDDWITLDLFQNSEEPNKFYATVDYSSSQHLQVGAGRTVH
ncbi:hypothetical protein SAMN05216203_3027 [Marinobacter daqiaonensis]|uniref:Uncharacterized protein n=1 Tax=Marinobacter daqiaonensis TaxID=650891 RepID=A0A1I6JHG8_9GAMM|nr:hypothetical protein [Marinobacter daqiaonensis]SFR78421.1 hypothetical protein SAMN05216203_3027 [Marinobacter daqiaonensis]